MNKKLIFNYAILIIIFISTFIFTISRNVLYIDETWTLNSCLNISNGLIPYKDFNLLVPPLFYYILSIPLIFVKHITSMRIMVSIIECLGIFTFYKILKKLEFNDIEQILYTLFFSIFLILQPIDYNLFNQIILLIGVYFVLSNNLKYQEFLLAIIICAMILTKQTTGVVFGLALFISHILLNKPNKAKIIYLIGNCLSIGLLFIVYLFVNNIFTDFFDFILFGISNFTTKSTVIDFTKENPIISIIYIIIIFLIYVFSMIKYKKEKDLKLIMLNLIFTSNLILLYPIYNTPHLILTLIFIYLTIIYLLKSFNKRIKDKKKSYIRTCTFLVIYISFIFIMQSAFEMGIKLESNIYKNKIISENVYVEFEEMIDYINNNPNYNYYSIEDCYVFISLETNNKADGYFNLYLNGNIGTKNPIDIIKETPENSIFYIYDDDAKGFWQTPKEARDYIRENFKYIDSVKNFDIYKK